jgi:hypothetical protein
MAQGAHSVAENLSNVGETIGRRVSDMADNLNPSTRELINRGREYGQKAQSVARSAMRTRPLTVIIVAVAFGFALGSMWR